MVENHPVDKAPTERLQRAQVRGQWTQVIVQSVAAVATVAAALFVFYTLETHQRQNTISATFKFVEPLTQKDYIHAVWRLQEFTVCFEYVECGELCSADPVKKREELGSEQYEKAMLDAHLSYLSPAESDYPNSKPHYNLARKWWSIVENEESHACKKSKPEEDLYSDNTTLQEQFMLIYQRVALLDVCRKNLLCDADIVLQMRDSLDFVTLQATTNYFRFAPIASREYYHVAVNSKVNQAPANTASKVPTYFLSLTDDMYAAEAPSIVHSREIIWRSYPPDR